MRLSSFQTVFSSGFHSRAPGASATTPLSGALRAPTPRVRMVATGRGAAPCSPRERRSAQMRQRRSPRKVAVGWPGTTSTPMSTSARSVPPVSNR